MCTVFGQIYMSSESTLFCQMHLNVETGKTVRQILTFDKCPILLYISSQRIKEYKVGTWIVFYDKQNAVSINE